jgi:peptidoglycan hydrolase-like protein with peptidoglycan-binding domain/3D (Asp-Asp-Asp) domain-containing protein
MLINKKAASLKLFCLAIIANSILSVSVSAQDSESVQIYPYEKTFTITAYYSPIEGQQRYIKGSLEADRKLNGNGTHGASGTPVYPGMVAAPKTYAFGTKLKIPGIGTVSVQDRGGAIVAANPEAQTYDRLDIWMGHGDEGLTRAMQWGKRTVPVLVYGIDESIEEQVEFAEIELPASSTPSASSNTSSTLANNSPYLKSFSLGDSSEQIGQIQADLQKLSYYNGEAHGKYDQATQQAIVEFQIDQQIVASASQYGAGYFGPQTGKALLAALNNPASNSNSPTETSTPIKETQTIIPTANASHADSESERIALAGNGLSFLQLQLQEGDSGQAVLELQTELKKMNLLAIEPTGYYGEVTTHAVFKFQQTQGLIATKDEFGAGIFGPQTRARLGQLVDLRIDTRRILAGNSNTLLAQN